MKPLYSTGFAAPLKSIPHPDFTKGDTIPKEAPHTWNLGPTGMRGWMYCDKRVTTDARQIYITAIAKDSPASNKLQKGDVILGVNGKKFSYDPRTEMGKAITIAEASTGKVDFLVWSKGKNKTITIHLKKIA